MRSKTNQQGNLWDYLPGLFLLQKELGTCVDFESTPLSFDTTEMVVKLEKGLVVGITDYWVNHILRWYRYGCNKLN